MRDLYFDPEGILGTGASLLADLTLLGYIFLIIPAMIAGYYYAKNGKHRPHHRNTMRAITLVNWILIFILMIPAITYDVTDKIGNDPDNTRYLFPAIHALLGLSAQILATWIIYRMWKEDNDVAAAKARGEKDLSKYWAQGIKKWMQITLGLWFAVSAIGVATYLTRYEVIDTFGADEPDIVVTPEVTEEALLVEETAEPAPVETEAVVATDEPAPVETEEVVAPVETEAAMAPTEEPVATEAAMAPTEEAAAPVETEVAMAPTEEAVAPVETEEPAAVPSTGSGVFDIQFAAVAAYSDLLVADPIDCEAILAVEISELPPGFNDGSAASIYFLLLDTRLHQIQRSVERACRDQVTVEPLDLRPSYTAITTWLAHAQRLLDRAEAVQSSSVLTVVEPTEEAVEPVETEAPMAATEEAVEPVETEAPMAATEEAVEPVATEEAAPPATEEASMDADTQAIVDQQRVATAAYGELLAEEPFSCADVLGVEITALPIGFDNVLLLLIDTRLHQVQSSVARACRDAEEINASDLRPSYDAIQVWLAHADRMLGRVQ